jgi:hypothetical protein
MHGAGLPAWVRRGFSPKTKLRCGADIHHPRGGGSQHEQNRGMSPALEFVPPLFSPFLQKGNFHITSTTFTRQKKKKIVISDFSVTPT